MSRGRPPAGGTAPLGGSARPLAEAYDVALLDLDGVVYVGSAAVPAAAAALAAARGRGMRTVFVTNNASRPPDVVAAHLTDLGVPAAAGDVVTSAQAAARLLAGRLPAAAEVLVVGGEGLRVALRERGLVPVARCGPATAAVVSGFSPDLGWRDLAEGTYAVREGLPWVASNLDRTVPTPRGLAPGNGLLVDVVAAAAGRRPDAVAGKPELPLHQEAVARTGSLHPLVVGDRLDTDVEGARRAGVDSLLVLTGVTAAEDLLAAPPTVRPTYLGPDLAALLVPHLAPQPTDAGWACGGWRARADRGEVVLSGGGDRWDGLRAAAAACWLAADEKGPLPHAALIEVVARLGLGPRRATSAQGASDSEQGA